MFVCVYKSIEGGWVRVPAGKEAADAGDRPCGRAAGTIIAGTKRRGAQGR